MIPKDQLIALCRSSVHRASLTDVERRYQLRSMLVVIACMIKDEELIYTINQIDQRFEVMSEAEAIEYGVRRFAVGQRVGDYFEQSLFVSGPFYEESCAEEFVDELLWATACITATVSYGAHLPDLLIQEKAQVFIDCGARLGIRSASALIAI